MRKLLLLAIIVIPAVELWGIIAMGRWIGGWQTFGLIVLTSAIGVFLVQSEGRRVLQEARAMMAAGQIPGIKLLDGLCIAAGGILLVLPGFITDIVGFTLAFPLTRPFYRKKLLGWIEYKLRSGSLVVRRY